MAKYDPEEVRKRLMREAAEEALAEAADNDPAVAKWLDDDFDKGITDLFGGTSPKDIQRELEKAIPDITEKDVREAQEAIRRAKKAAEGGWLSKPNPKEAERILMGVRGIREVRKRKSKGCAVVGALLLTLGGSTIGAVLYGAAEIVSALNR